MSKFQPTLQVEVLIEAPQTAVFEHIADLTRHHTWAADELTITPLFEGDVTKGARYQSHALVKGRLTFEAELEVIEYAPHHTFAFRGSDKTGHFQHHFHCKSVNETAVLLTRQASFELTLKEWLIYWLLYYPVRLPAARRALAQLKAVVEG